jgi:hypothetical protein
MQSFAYQTEAYMHGAPIRSFSPYFTHSGLQGLGFAALDALTPLAPSAFKLRLFGALTSALVAAAYTLLVLWLHREFGLGTALVSGLVVLASPWLVAFARNLYWSLWLFLLPPLAIGAALSTPNGRGRPSLRLAIAAFVALLVRFLSGFEFMTSTAAMASAPVLYYAIRDRWPLRAALRRFGLLAVAAVAAVAVALAALTVQITCVTGSPRDAVRHLRFAVGRRTSGDPDRFPPVYAAALRAKTSEVVRSYVTDRADRGGNAHCAAPFRWIMARTYAELIGWIFLAACWVALRTRWRPAGERSRPLALAAAVMCCLLGILAWLVVFKAHSFIHLHVNPLMWHLLFLPLGAALVFRATADAMLLLGRKARLVHAPAPHGP